MLGRRRKRSNRGCRARNEMPAKREGAYTDMLTQSAKYLGDLDEARERVRAFWRGEELDRPMLHIRVKNPEPHTEPWPGEEPKGKARDKDRTWQAWHAKVMEREVIGMCEALPIVSISYADGIGLSGELAGGSYAYHAGRAWIEPWPEVLEQPEPRFDRQEQIIAELDEIHKAVVQSLDAETSISPPVTGDPLTVLSLFRGAERFCLDLLEAPESVMRWARACNRKLLGVYEHLYRCYSEPRGGYTSSWLNLSAPGRFEAVQCDFAVMISPAMFASYALPLLKEWTEYFDHSLYHLDGTCQRRFFGQLAQLPRLTGIQWNPEPGQRIVDWIETYRDIRNRGWVLHFNAVDMKTVENAVAVTKALGPTGLSIALPVFDTVGEAEAAVRAIEDACR